MNKTRTIKEMSDEELQRIAERARKAINDVLIDEGIPENERQVFWSVFDR